MPQDPLFNTLLQKAQSIGPDPEMDIANWKLGQMPLSPSGFGVKGKLPAAGVTEQQLEKVPESIWDILSWGRPKMGVGGILTELERLGKARGAGYLVDRAKDGWDKRGDALHYLVYNEWPKKGIER